MINVSSTRCCQAKFTCFEWENAAISWSTTKILPLVCKSVTQVCGNEPAPLEDIGVQCMIWLISNQQLYFVTFCNSLDNFTSIHPDKFLFYFIYNWWWDYHWWEILTVVFCERVFVIDFEAPSWCNWNSLSYSNKGCKTKHTIQITQWNVFGNSRV